MFLSFPHGRVASRDYLNNHLDEDRHPLTQKGAKQQSLVGYLRSHDREVVQLGLDSISSGLLSSELPHTSIHGTDGRARERYEEA